MFQAQFDHPKQRDDINRGLASLQAGDINFKVPALARIQLLRVFTIVKSLDLFYNSGCLLAPKNNKKI